MHGNPCLALRALGTPRDTLYGHHVKAHSNRRSIDHLLAAVQASLQRMTPSEAWHALGQGDVVIDTRTPTLRKQDGEVPGATIIGLSTLEWECDPDTGVQHPDIARACGRLDMNGEARGFFARLIVLCDEGYSSSFAAQRLQHIGFAGATDVIGGFQRWRNDGLPIVGRRGVVTQRARRLDE